jgi:hypothetical protein
VISTVLRLASTVATLFVLLGFGLFAIDEAKEGSAQQQARLEGISQPAPGPVTEAAREKEHGDVREFIDDVNDVLLDPFSDVVDSDEVWVQRGVPALLAFLVYGLLLRILAAYALRLP